MGSFLGCRGPVGKGLIKVHKGYDNVAQAAMWRACSQLWHPNGSSPLLLNEDSESSVFFHECMHMFQLFEGMPEIRRRISRTHELRVVELFSKGSRPISSEERRDLTDPSL